MNDLDERPWFVFQLPQAVAHVPAVSEDAARRILVSTCYKDAPVSTWPLIGTRWTSRQALHDSLLRPRPTLTQRIGDDR